MKLTYFLFFFISFFEKFDPFEKISDLQKEIIKLTGTQEKVLPGKVNCKNETLREILTMWAGLQGNDIFLHWQQTES